MSDRTPSLKNCPKCGITRTIVEFSKASKTKDGLQAWCKKCFRETDSARYGHQRKLEEDPDYVKKAYMRNTYGLEWDEYQWLIMSTPNCPFCDVEMVNEGRDSNRSVIDHCHETGKVRGVICSQCNRALGKLGDNLASMKKVVDYLELAA